MKVFLFLLPFLVFGIAFIVVGIWITARMFGKHSVEVKAECIDIIQHNAVHEDIRPGRQTTYVGAKVPVYHYWYKGKEYTSRPTLVSNRPGYHPQLGPCTIRINPAHPEKVYSTERKSITGIFLFIGILYIVLCGGAVVVFLTR